MQRRQRASFELQPIAVYPRKTNMTIAHSLGIGVLLGIALFFVLQRLGVLDKWLEKFDR